MIVKIFEASDWTELPVSVSVNSVDELRCLVSGLGGEATISTNTKNVFTGDDLELAILKNKPAGLDTSKKKELASLSIDVDCLKCQMDSMEKSVKDTNKKITAIRNQIRKEKGRKPL